MLSVSYKTGFFNQPNISRYKYYSHSQDFSSGPVIKTPAFQGREHGFDPWWGYSGASQVALVVKNQPANAGDVRDVSFIPGLGRSSGGGHGDPLQYSCLENPMDRGD